MQDELEKAERRITELERASGNADKMRDALEEQLRYWNAHVRTRDEEEMRKRTEAALAAPARNCDRFATAEEAVAAFADHLRAWENEHGVLSEYPDHTVQVPAGAFAWLFAPAEGGDHA